MITIFYLTRDFLMCEDCNCELSVDIPFGMMAEIVDYLMEQNKK